MSKNITEIPYTEIVERVQEISRSPENSRLKIRGAVQDVYCREIPYKFDWNFLMASTSIISEAEYQTGTVNVTTNGTTATFSSDTVLTSAFTGRKIKVSGNEVVYDLTFSATTAATISPSFLGTTNAVNASFSIFQPTYPLPLNFDRFPKDGGIYKWQGGRKEIISEESYQEYADLYSAGPSVPSKVRLVGTDTAGRQLVEFRPGPRDARAYGVDYIKKITPMRETSAGTVTISASGTTVTGNSSCRFLEAQTGDYLRINDFGTSQESSWHRIIAISHNSSLTLQASFVSSGVTAASYVISSAPDMPAKIHPAIIFGALRQMTVDQNDPNAIFYIARYAEVLSDSKRIYVSRVYSQEVETIAEDYEYRR